MSAALDFALEEETRRTRAYGDWSRAAVTQGDPGVSVLAATQSATAVLGQLGRSPGMTNHAEQMRHNTGLVWNCVRVISQRMAGQAIRLARKLKSGQTAARAFRPHKDYLPGYLKNAHAGLEVVPSHPVLDAIERPNQLMVRWSLVAITGMHLECCGRSYWWIFKNPPKSTRPYTILPLPPSWVEPVHKPDRLYAEWKVTPGNSSQSITVPGDEIVQLYYPDPENPLAALSPLQKIAKSILADESITEAQRRSFGNGIWPGMAITLARNTDVNGQQGNRPKLTPAQRKQLIAPILQAYRGVINYDEPIILDGWVEAVQKISQSPREMDFLKSHQITKERITQGFGVNPIVMGQVQDANRASAATADDHFCGSCVNPKLELLSQYFTAWLLPVFGIGDDHVLYFEPAHSTDPDFELKRHQTLVDRGAETIGEFRAENGLPEKAGGNVAIRMNTYTTVNLDEEFDFDAEPAAPPAGSPPPAGGDGGDGQEGDLPAELAGGGNQGSGRQGGGRPGGRPVAGLLEYREPRAHLAGTLEPARQVRLWQKAQGKAEAALASGLRHYFARVAREATEGVGLGSGTARELARRCFSPRAWDRDLKEAVRPRLRQIAEQGAKRELLLHRPRKASELGDLAACLKAPRLAVPPDVRRAMDAFVKQALNKPYWKGINDQVRDDLEAAFQKAIDAGKSGKELADAVQTVLGPAASKKRATRIARTESTGFMNSGQQAARKKLAALGAVTGKKWAALPGKRTRETHAEANGQTVAVEAAFTVGGHECQYPGDLDLPPEERVNCRCASLSTTVPLTDAKAWALAEVFCLWEA